jgi:Tfp pilus assembly protein PilV
MNGKDIKRLKNQRGIAMMVALLALLLLAAIGMGLMFMADTENSVNNNYRDSQKAYFAARAGAEDARLLLARDATLNGNAMALTTGNAGVPFHMIYLENPTNAEAIDPTTAGGSTLAANPYLDDQLCWERFAHLTLTPGAGPCGSNGQGGQLLTDSTAFTATTMTQTAGVNGSDALPFKWVRITAKQNLMGALGASGTKVANAPANDQQVCWDGSQEVVVAGTCASVSPTVMPVWEITSLAVTPKVGANPGSRRMVQMEVALNPPLIPPAPISVMAPVSLQGSYILNAYDNCKCSCTSTGNGDHQVTACVPRAGQPANACASSAHAIYTQNSVGVIGNSGSTITSFGSDPTSGTTTTVGPSVQGVNPWPNSLNINNLIAKYSAGASVPNYTCTGTQNLTTTPATYKDCGTQSSQQFGTYPTGLPLEPALGSYTSVTEYIPGSVHLTSAASGSGILIVDGDLDINGGLNWYGLILVRGKVSFTGGAGASTNLYGAILAGDDVNATNQPQGDNFGGSINFQYDVCALNRIGGSTPPQLLATHEIMY